jgi:SAM-dependent methyltransferase
MVAAYDEWMAANQPPEQERWSGQRVDRLRVDLSQPLSLEVETIAGYLTPDDSLLDIGGGAGRLGLPLAAFCRQVVNVEPSPAMQAAFAASAADAGIKNVRSVEETWPQTDAQGDVCLVAHVTYFVRDIEPFLARLNSAARRRVIISINSEANPNNVGPFYELLYQKPYPRSPGYRELLPVLWDMGILPEVHVAPAGWAMGRIDPATELQRRANSEWIRPEDRERALELFGAHKDELYTTNESGMAPRTQASSRGLIITWQPT